ncbi:methyltransferase domain protein, putative, partial [Rhizoctonia solani AG-3 Rhs1AP]
MEAPTSFLPPLKRLGDYNGPQIHNILTRLVTIYLPKVRGTTLIDEDTEPFQSDDFERSFAIRWLTGFIARGEEWTELYTDEEDPGGGAPTATSDSSIGRFQTEFLDDTYVARTTAFDRAAALLGACAGTSASGAISRELKFATSSAPFTGGSTHLDGPNPDSSTITILLQDESISAGDHTAVGLQTWGSACILAERIARDPLAFGLPDTSPDSSSRSKGARVLELGAGTGLLSLLAGKLVECAGAMTGNVDSKYTIVATDYHPAVLANLRANVQGNFPDSSAESDSLIDVQTLDWSLYLTGKPTTDLSRAPSTAPTPAVGTPVSVSGQNGTAIKTSVTPPSAKAASISGLAMSSPIQTPSFSIASSVSTPTTSHSPQTPQTPRTIRSPPPNLARAVFSRLIAQGLKFEMPGGPPGIDQNFEPPKKSDFCLDSSNPQDDFSAHGFGTVPITINFDSSAASPDSDVPVIENVEVIEITKSSPTRVSSPLLPLGASKPELLCAYLQDKATSSTAENNNLIPCLDEIDTLCSDGTHVAPIGDLGKLACFKVSNKVLCLGGDSMSGDSAVGIEAPPFRIAERTDGPVYDRSLGQRQAPHIASSITATAYPLGELRTPSAIDYESETNATEKSDPKIGHEIEDNDDPSNLISNDSISNAGHTSYSQASKTPVDPPFDQPFDVIFGADVVYELSHITLVRGVVERLLRKPSYKLGARPAYFHLIMPLRPTHADEANSVDMAFPRAEDIVSKGVGEDEVLAIVKLKHMPEALELVVPTRSNTYITALVSP